MKQFVLGLAVTLLSMVAHAEGSVPSQEGECWKKLGSQRLAVEEQLSDARTNAEYFAGKYNAYYQYSEKIYYMIGKGAYPADRADILNAWHAKISAEKMKINTLKSEKDSLKQQFEACLRGK